MPISKIQLISFKSIFINLANLIIFLPSFILIMIFSRIAYDAKEYFGYVILYGVQFIIFVFLLVSIFTIINILTMKKSSLLGNVINSLILFWFFLCWFLVLLYNIMPDNKVEFFKYFKYFSLYSLVVNTLHFSNSETGSPIIVDTFNEYKITYTPFKYISKNTEILVPIFMIINISGAILINWLITKIFKNKELNI